MKRCRASAPRSRASRRSRPACGKLCLAMVVLICIDMPTLRSALEAGDDASNAPSPRKLVVGGGVGAVEADGDAAEADVDDALRRRRSFMIVPLVARRVGQADARVASSASSKTSGRMSGSPPEKTRIGLPSSGSVRMIMVLDCSVVRSSLLSSCETSSRRQWTQARLQPAVSPRTAVLVQASCRSWSCDFHSIKTYCAAFSRATEDTEHTARLYRRSSLCSLWPLLLFAASRFPAALLRITLGVYYTAQLAGKFFRIQRMKIYTRQGDDGTTGLLGKDRVSKAELRHGLHRHG